MQRDAGVHDHLLASQNGQGTLAIRPMLQLTVRDGWVQAVRRGVSLPPISASPYQDADSNLLHAALLLEKEVQPARSTL